MAKPTRTLRSVVACWRSVLRSGGLVAPLLQLVEQHADQHAHQQQGQPVRDVERNRRTRCVQYGGNAQNLADDAGERGGEQAGPQTAHVGGEDDGDEEQQLEGLMAHPRLGQHAQQ